MNLYKILYQQGIGTKCSAFYIGWAHYYNSANHFKQAESIFNLGLQLKAEPLHELETAQKSFRFSVAQRMLYNDESSKKRTISSLQEQRQQITSLSPHQNQMPSSKKMRTADSPQNDQYSSSSSSSSSNQAAPTPPQQLQQQYASPHEFNNFANSNAIATAEPGFAICSSLNYVYDDSNGYASMEEQQQHQKSANFTFECGFQMQENFISYARNSNDQWHAQLFLEEPYDPNRRCFYPKKLVYPGDGCEYSLEELKAHSWKMKMAEKRRQEELRIQRENEEKLRKEQEAIRVRQEQERLSQEAEARRLREEQELIRKEQEAQIMKLEQEKLQRQHEEAERVRRQQEEEQRNHERYNQSQMYQMQQQQQRWNYHQNSSPASYGSYYHQSYENSPQYSYSHDHQYQTHYPQAAAASTVAAVANVYQHSPQNYQNSPNYHPQQSVIVNRSHYETHHHHNHHYYMNYPTHSPIHHPQQQQHPSLPPHHHHFIDYHHQQQPQSQALQPVVQMAHPNHIQNHQTEEQKVVSQQQPFNNNNSQQQQQQQQLQQQNQQSQQPHFEEPDYQDVEYLIDHQAEIDPKMLKQPIIEGKSKRSERDEDEDESEEVSSYEEEENEEEIPPIVNSYMLDDLEEQIEASTISFSSNGKSRDKKITIKFRKEKTTTTIVNSESNSESSSNHAQSKVPLESASTSSSASNKKKKKKNQNEVPSSFDGENTQFMPSGQNSCSSTNNGGENPNNISFSKITFNGCITPVRKQAASKSSTPISSYKFLKNQSSFVSNQNDDSICSYNGDQNSFFQAENDEDFRSRRLDKALATIDDHMKKRDVDPFSSELCRSFMVKLNFPNSENSSDYKVISSNLPKLMKNQTVALGGISYQIEKEVGRGAYGAVYR